MNAISPALADALATTALSSTHPDAGLIRLARAHERLGREWNAAGDHGQDDDHPAALAAEVRRDRLFEQQGELLDGILSAPVPVTLEGLQAVAAALATWDQELLKDGPGDTGQCLTTLLVRSLIEQPDAALPDLNPDAALLALRPEFLRYRAAAYRFDHDDNVVWEDGQINSMLLNSVCRQIVDMPAAVTAEGRKLQASAALYQMWIGASCNDPAEAGGSEAVVWRYLMLQGGEVYPACCEPDEDEDEDEDDGEGGDQAVPLPPCPIPSPPLHPAVPSFSPDDNRIHALYLELEGVAKEIAANEAWVPGVPGYDQAADEEAINTLGERSTAITKEMLAQRPAGRLGMRCWAAAYLFELQYDSPDGKDTALALARAFDMEHLIYVPKTGESVA